MYEDGQIENDHRFDAASNTWVPVIPPVKPKMSTGRKIGIGFGGAFAALFLIGLIGAVGDGADTTTSESIAAPAATSSAPIETYVAPAPEPAEPAPAPEEPAPAPAPAEPQFSVSEQNAIEKAESYLEFSAFSKKGLIEQLEFEGFSNADANVAVANISVNWKAQAVKKAQSYLEFSSFSRSSLIAQLKFEGFTSAQAKYGATQVGL